MAKTVADVIKMVKENEVKFVDFRFTDTRGKEQHVTVPVSHFDEDKFTSGHAFDGSSIAGWKGIEASDMLLMPDPNTANIDPFFEEVHAVPELRRRRAGRRQGLRPRPALDRASRAEAYLKASGMGDTAFFGPEPEFFIFDDVRWSADMSGSFVQDRRIRSALEHRQEARRRQQAATVPTVKGGYFPVPPVDSTQDLRAEMSLILESLGIPVEVFHHEVAGAGQNEIGTKFSTLVQRADWTQMLKYVVHNVANSYGKTATFMPKPLVGDNGSAACTCTSPSGRMARTCSPVTVMPACRTSRCTTSAASSSMPAR
jgi:glutamine synthetase